MQKLIAANNRASDPGDNSASSRAERRVHRDSPSERRLGLGGIAMSHELTRDDFLDHLAAFERRLVERLDLLERLIALGFDDATDQLRVRLGNPESATANAGLNNGRN
jgi:hypothetical protein